MKKIIFLIFTIIQILLISATANSNITIRWEKKSDRLNFQDPSKYHQAYWSYKNVVNVPLTIKWKSPSLGVFSHDYRSFDIYGVIKSGNIAQLTIHPDGTTQRLYIHRQKGVALESVLRSHNYFGTHVIEIKDRLGTKLCLVTNYYRKEFISHYNCKREFGLR